MSLAGALLDLLASALRRPGGTRAAQSPPTREGAAARPAARLAERPVQESPGHFGTGATRDLSREEISRLRPSYSPQLDGEPDPGEVVWTWVPFVEHDGRGKDRPVLIISRLDDGAWAGCYLSTKQHRGFVSVGSGSWDSQGRESFLSPERVLRVSGDGMRRESTGLNRSAFDRAIAAVRAAHGLR